MVKVRLRSGWGQGEVRVRGQGMYYVYVKSSQPMKTRLCVCACGILQEQQQCRQHDDGTGDVTRHFTEPQWEVTGHCFWDDVIYFLLTTENTGKIYRKKPQHYPIMQNSVSQKWLQAMYKPGWSQTVTWRVRSAPTVGIELWKRWSAAYTETAWRAAWLGKSY